MRYVWRALLIVGGLGAVFVIGALLFLRTAQFQKFLHGHIVSTLDTALPGAVSLGGLGGSVWRDLQLTDLIVRYDKKDVVHIPRLTVRYALRRLLSGQVSLTQVDVYEPVVRLAQDEAGNWDLVQALVPNADRGANPSPGIGLGIVLGAVTIHGGAVEVAPAGRSPYRLHGMTL